MNVDKTVEEIYKLDAEANSIREKCWSRIDEFRVLALETLEVLYPDQHKIFYDSRGTSSFTKDGIKFTKKTKHGYGFGVFPDEDEKDQYYTETFTVSWDDIKLYIEETS